MKTITLNDINELAENIKSIIIENLSNYVNTEEDEIKDNLINKDNLADNESLGDSLSEIIDNIKTDKNVSKEWWQEYKRKFKSGDIVYIDTVKKFGIFVHPANKINKVKIRLLKNNNKNKIYTTDWLFDLSEIESVKHNNKVNKKFIEDDISFKVK